MTHFDLAAWNKVLGDILIVVPYPLSWTCIYLYGYMASSIAHRDSTQGPETDICFGLALTFTFLSHAISAGWIR